MGRIGRKIYSVIVAFLLAGSAAGVGGIALCCRLQIIPQDLLSGGIRKYHVNFYDDFGDNGQLIYTTPTVKRGEEVDYSLVPTPVKRDQVEGGTYTFLGWDVTYDNIPDILPTKLYSTLHASAVWLSLEPQISSEEESSSEETNAYSSYDVLSIWEVAYE